ncbi:MAG TPA: MerR family transcriptional regulator, partial [Alphaproteobacteria bacterium]|nr:MerR family transcriptional regulator [Alphaproteobacteria bacterium]
AKPMSGNKRYLSVTEAAEALGVSTRALRLYEEKGLVNPVRTQGGWRAYGADALTRLHQIIALKRMGLELSTIARLLKGALSSLDSVLALQEQNLTARQAETHRALDLVRRARSRLSSGDALSVDDLTTLTRETTMNVQNIMEAMKALEPFERKYFTPAQFDQVRSNIGKELDGFAEAWIEALTSLQAAMKTGDEKSAEAIEAARRWRIIRMRFDGGDPDIRERNERMWREAFADPAIAQKVPLKPEHMAFIERATKALEAKEAVSRKSA